MNEKLLLIAPVFFDYYKEIIKGCEALGYETDFICDAPSNSNISKAMGRVNKNFILNSTKKYYRSRVLPLLWKTTYDKVLVVGGMTFSFTADMVEEMREIQKDALFVLYQWDSESNIPYVRNIHRYFDRVFTFDPVDSENSSVYIYMPQFYTDLYREISVEENEIKYDCSYIGTAHPKKYTEINEIAEAIKDVMPRQFIYHYMPSYLKYFYHRYKEHEFRGVKYSEFEKKKLTNRQVAEITALSGCILDAPQKGQNGITLRVLDALAARKKVMTTNEYVTEYDFYRPENIYVFDGGIDTGHPFFTEPYKELPKEIYDSYSLASWIEKILS